MGFADDNTLFGMIGSPQALQNEDQANELLRRLQMAAQTQDEGAAPETMPPFGGMTVPRPPAAAENPRTIAPSVDSRYVDVPPTASPTLPASPPAGPSTTSRPQPQVSSAPPQRRAGSFPVPAPAAVAGGSAPVIRTQSPDFEPTFGERLQHFGAALTGKNPGSLEEQIRGRKSAYDAMISMGVDPATAKAGALNPDIMKMVLAQKLGAKSLPSWTVIDHDSLGQPVQGWVNPQTMQAFNADGTPYLGHGRHGAAGGGDPVDEAMAAGTTGPEFLKLLHDNDPEMASLVKKFGNYELPAPTGAAMRNPRTLRALALAEQAFPGFSQQDYKTGLAVKTSFRNGLDANEVKSYNTVMGHLTDAYGLVDSLGNTGSSWINKPYNAIRGQWDSDFQKARSDLLAKMDIAIAEVNKATSGKPITVDERQAWRERIHQDASPVDLHSTLKSFTEAIKSRMDASAEKYNKGLKLTPDNPDYKTGETLLSDKARDKFHALLGDAPAKTPDAPAAPPAPPAPALALATPDQLRGMPKVPPPNARRGKDGKLYMPNPNKPGTWLPWIEE